MEDNKRKWREEKKDGGMVGSEGWMDGRRK